MYKSGLISIVTLTIIVTLIGSCMSMVSATEVGGAKMIIINNQNAGYSDPKAVSVNVFNLSHEHYSNFTSLNFTPSEGVYLEANKDISLDMSANDYIVHDIIFIFERNHGWSFNHCYVGFHELDIREPLTFLLQDNGGFTVNIQYGNSNVKTVTSNDPTLTTPFKDLITWITYSLTFDFEDVLRSAHIFDTVHLKAHLLNIFNEPYNGAKINFVINNQKFNATIDENGMADIPYSVNFVGEYDYHIEVLDNETNNVIDNSKSYKGRVYKMETNLFNLKDSLTTNINDEVNLTALLVNGKNQGLINELVDFRYSTNGSLIGSAYTDDRGYASVNFTTATPRGYDYYVEYLGTPYQDKAKIYGHVNVVDKDVLNLTLTATKGDDGFKLNLKTWLNRANKPLTNKVIHLFANNISIANITTTFNAGTGFYYYKTNDFSHDYIFEAVSDEGSIHSYYYDRTNTTFNWKVASSYSTGVVLSSFLYNDLKDLFFYNKK
ncbi:MAG: hypothetical protein LBT10_07660 [Methanobrevibacter sp.]|jgi:hypothetical protein|nr:hypothetical protein [Methanobrevibacter sp.]